MYHFLERGLSTTAPLTGISKLSSDFITSWELLCKPLAWIRSDSLWEALCCLCNDAYHTKGNWSCPCIFLQLNIEFHEDGNRVHVLSSHHRI
jgi:hypothetical protein